MNSVFKGKNQRDTEAASETVIPTLINNNRSFNSIKNSGSALNKMLESESFDSTIEKKNKELL